MQSRLFIVEGATGSGKSTLCDLLQSQGLTVLRGIPSQNPEDNQFLLPQAKQLVGDTVFNFRRVFTLSSEQREEILRKFIKASFIQHEEAVRLRREGKTVFLNRSVISLVSLLKLASAALEPSNRELASSLGARGDVIMEQLIGHGNARGFIDQVDGIILMERPLIALTREREGMSGLEKVESQFIGDLTKSVAQQIDAPLVLVDANSVSLQQELELVQKFIQ